MMLSHYDEEPCPPWFCVLLYKLLILYSFFEQKKPVSRSTVVGGPLYKIQLGTIFCYFDQLTCCMTVVLISWQALCCWTTKPNRTNKIKQKILFIKQGKLVNCFCPIQLKSQANSNSNGFVYNLDIFYAKARVFFVFNTVSA